MVEENNIRLIALIEAINYDSNFKIINFLPGFKVKKIVESGIHKQDREKRYCFSIEKEDVFQIPYGSNLKDISVIVGENGTGKTTIINKMLRGNSNTYLILEKNNEFCIYSTSRQDDISLQYLDKTLANKYSYNKSDSQCPHIIKFSNAEEFYDGNIYIPQGAIDASRFMNIHDFNWNLGINDNKKYIYLRETMNQIRFVEEYKHKVSEFVDYTNKGVTVEFNSDGVPFQSQQLVYLDRFKNSSINDNEKKIVNFRLICYFSVLINYIIEIFYSEDNTSNTARLLEFHLLRYEDKDNLSLQYQSISVDSDRFLPTKYSIGGLRAVVPTSLKDCREPENWIKLWHLYFILHLYIKLILTNEEDITKKYAERIKNEYVRVDKNNFLLLLDEVDLGLHPEWQRKWVHSALPIIEKIFENQHLQLIITSHSPILLSDIYKENVIFLTKDKDVSINQEFEKTFGQNIYTLYKSSFFLNKLMGEYAYKTIEDTVEYLSAKISEKTLGKGNLYYELEENKKILTAKKIIDSVGDIIIANQLKELFERAFPTIDEESDLTKIAQLKNQINKLQQELEELERDERK